MMVTEFPWLTINLPDKQSLFGDMNDIYGCAPWPDYKGLILK